MHCFSLSFVFFFCKQKTAYEMRISDWSPDVCSSDLRAGLCGAFDAARPQAARTRRRSLPRRRNERQRDRGARLSRDARICAPVRCDAGARRRARSEEHTSELQSLMRISYAVFCLKKKKYMPKQMSTPTTSRTYTYDYKHL